ncbi:MAG: hypothetical protein HYY84_16890 [Deltaproteobacteria bacterium]|nr:hypothetical protein [Deltaproteobacteria bacterium]
MQRKGHNTHSRDGRAITVLAILGLVVALIGLARSAAAATGFDARGRARYTVSAAASGDALTRIDDKALFESDGSSSTGNLEILSLGFSRQAGVEVFHRLLIKVPATHLTSRIGTSIDIGATGIAVDYLERTRDGIAFQATRASGAIRISATSTGGASDLVSGSFELHVEDGTRGSDARELKAGTFTTDETPNTASSGRELSPSATGGSALEDPPTAGCGGEATVSHQTDSSGCGGTGTTSEPEDEKATESGCSGDSAPSDGDSSGGCKGDSDSSDDSGKCALSQNGKVRSRPRSFATRVVGSFGPPFVVIVTLVALRRRRPVKAS